jgi:hypothetical protein
LTPTLDRRPVIETIGLVRDRYYDWYKGAGKDDLMNLLRRADPTPAAPVTVLRVLCAGQGYARLGKAMRLFPDSVISKVNVNESLRKDYTAKDSPVGRPLNPLFSDPGNTHLAAYCLLSGFPIFYGDKEKLIWRKKRK